MISDTTGSNTGALSLVKLGTGTLTLTGANIYSGSTAIQNGILATSGGLDNRLPTTTTLTLGDSSNDAGTLQLGVRHGGSTANQTLAGLFTTGTGANTVTVGAGTSILTLDISGSDTFGGVLSGNMELTKNGVGTLTLTNGSNSFYSTSLLQGAVSFVSGALGANPIIGITGGTLQWGSGNTQDVSSYFGMYLYGAATLDTNGNNVTLSGVIQSVGSYGLTKIGAGTLTLTAAETYAGNTTVSQGTLTIGGSLAGSASPTGSGILNLDASNTNTINIGNATLNSSSTIAANLINTGGGQVDVTGSVALGNATLSVSNSGMDNSHGVIRVLVKNDGTDAVSGTFNGLSEGSQLTVGGVTYFITYKYNAEAGTFDNGNDVALCSSLVSVLAPVATNPALVTAAYTTVTNTSTRDASEHLEASTTEKDISQYQLPTASSLSAANGNFPSLSSPWPNSGYTVSYSSEDPSIASVNSSGLVTFLTPGSCRILVSVSGGGSTSLAPPLQTNLEFRLTGAYSGGVTTTLVNQFTPNTFSAASNLLVLYNAALPASVALKNYYLANRPGVSGAQTLGITGLPLPTAANNFGHDDYDVANDGYDESQILSQLNTWAAANPTAASNIRYVVMLAGLPSREDSANSVEVGGTPVSIPYAVYRATTRLGASASSTYLGVDQFTVAEYGHPLVAMLDAGDNALNVTGLAATNSSSSGSYQTENFALASGVASIRRSIVHLLFGSVAVFQQHVHPDGQRRQREHDLLVELHFG